MKHSVVAFLTGIVMAVGLSLSEMINPARVIGFLDVFGKWDPTLAFVMAGALAVSVVAFRFVLKKEKPFCSESFQIPTNTKVDKRLILGSVLFGAGWGLAGFCPAPAVAALSFGLAKPFIFCGAMICGMVLYRFSQK